MDWISILAGVGGAIAIAVLAAAISCFVWLQRPRLRAQAPRGALASGFQGELREKAFRKVFLEHAKTCEMEGFVVTCDPDVVKELMIKTEHSIHRSRFYTASRYLLYGMDGILNMEGDIWKRHKDALYPLFHADNVDTYCSKFHAIASRHADAWAAGVEADDGVLPADPLPAAVAGSASCADLVAATRAIGAEALIGFAMSMRPGEGRADDLVRELTRYGKHLVGIGNGVGGACAVPLGLWRVTACTSRIRALVRAELVERFGAATAAEAGPEAVAAVRAEDAAAPRRDGLRAMWLAGFGAVETASEVNHVYGAHKAAGYSMACMLWRLSRPENAEWVGHLREEWASVLGRPGKGDPEGAQTAAPTRKMASSLPVTQAVINETMRLHVVSLCTGRQTGRPLEVDGVVLPPGTEVGIALQAMHTHPDHFSDPDEFRPGRWLTGSHPLRTADTASRRAFLPFLSGRRKCAGQLLAEMEHVVGLHAVLDRYDVRTTLASLTMRADLYSSLEGSVDFRCVPRADL